jgi:hypothetical protein
MLLNLLERIDVVLMERLQGEVLKIGVSESQSR